MILNWKKKAQQWKYDELHSLIRLKVYRTGYFKIIFDIVLNFQVMIKYSSSLDEDPGYRKSGIPAPIHKVLMAKFAADSGSASGASGMGESSASDEDIIQTSGSGEAGSGSQKKDEVSEAASGSGEALPVTVASPTPGTTEIGSGSGSLAEGMHLCLFIHSTSLVFLPRWNHKYYFLSSNNPEYSLTY